ncbi:class I SAM-dependent methyltransferase [Candidatus Kaiserbacteria bacterium]|nr:class I SAM-dependent methyltransferase [Candidatus Kaiserbacteria bacterium]
MASIKDDRGYNQGFAPSKSTTVRMERRTALLLSEMELMSDTRILEIGCGTGEISHWMARRSPAHVLGTDICVPFIEEARKKYQLPNLQYEVVDFNNPDSFSGTQFDYIVGNGILHHLYHTLDEAFASMLRLLKENGKIIFLEPNLYNPYIYLIFSYPKLRTLANLEPGEMAFSKRFIMGALARAGLEHIQVDYKDFLLPGIPDFLITPSIIAGAVAEKIPFIRGVSQSIFIRARKSSV